MLFKTLMLCSTFPNMILILAECRRRYHFMCGALPQAGLKLCTVRLSERVSSVGYNLFFVHMIRVMVIGYGINYFVCLFLCI